MRITRTELRSDPIEHRGTVVVPVARHIEVRWGGSSAGVGFGYTGPSRVETGGRAIRVVDWGLVLQVAALAVVILGFIARRLGGRHGPGK